MNAIYKIWLIFNPSLILIGLFSFLIVLALAIHLILLSTTDFNWLEDGIPAIEVATSPAVPQQM
ncbi:light-harvesting antenna LH1, alpha subunit [Thiohalocapsa sp. ML1]|jgi:light-harvesting complex 1 alpha chain|uniref:Light-harvesting 1 antenna complex alpha subunit 1 n=1 Tax=Lamprocystis purpurea TaxID=61598 RepID=Q83ZZ8_9GAMM|nr:light-harvesting antenna LH1, alpha subunit [Thiohalocapsa sp. ML1]AAO47389.1 light-harvesting 1 antenna complex alpha subunit 1 [Thiohalocapsa sp. ML1]